MGWAGPFPLRGKVRMGVVSMPKISPLQKERSRLLRKNMTDAERLLWRQLRMKQLGAYGFRRQVPVAGYIIDFVCLEAGLAIEVDGGQHASRESRDAKRSAELKKGGLRVLRFWNNDVLSDIESVKAAIWQALQEANHPHPRLPPEGEGV